MRLAPSFTLACVAVVAALCCSPREALAIERQHHFGLDPTLALLKVDDKSSVSTAVGLGAHYTYGLSDQFNFMAELNASFMVEGEKLEAATAMTPATPRTRPTQIGHALAGVGYVIDVLRWVPYFGVLAGGYRLAGGTLESQQFIFGAAVQVGLDYQLSRQWAVGGAVQQHFLLTQMSTYPSYTTVMVRLEYMWGY
jgi:hypothetical protein